MKKILEKILQDLLTRLKDIFINAVERMVNADIDGDGTIGGNSKS